MKTITKIIGVSAVAVLTGVYFFFMGGEPKKAPVVTQNNNYNSNPTPVAENTNTNPTPAPQATTTQTVPTKPVETSKTKYKDGSYSVVSNYSTPAGMESIGVSLTISGDKVTNAQVTNKAEDGTSSRFQNKFISNFSSTVLGAKLDTLRVGVISGASLTSGGFNDALAKIKSQALN